MDKKINLAFVPKHLKRAAKYDFFKLLQNNGIRYYDKFKPALISGRAIGARLVLEVYATTGKEIRTWMETYDHQNKVIQIHPKMPINDYHYLIDPNTGKEINPWKKEINLDTGEELGRWYLNIKTKQITFQQKI